MTLALIKTYNNKLNGSFLNNLKGEIVYVHRDGLSLNVYKISANGKNKKLLYHHGDKTNSSCSFPMWSNDGTEIYFTAMKDGEWERFVIGPDGNNVGTAKNEEAWLLSRNSRDGDIFVDQGSVYYQDENGKKIQVYSFRFWDGVWFTGASEASWSPDKKFIIFQSCAFPRPCSIFIANKEGTKVVKITEGQNPDWKY